jgi:hypothetical protein
MIVHNLALVQNSGCQNLKYPKIPQMPQQYKGLTTFIIKR